MESRVYFYVDNNLELGGVYIIKCRNMVDSWILCWVGFWVMGYSNSEVWS